MGLYRCQNAECSTDPHGRLIFDFEAATPTCPKCGADSRRPEHKNTIVKREVVHFHVIDSAGPDMGFGKRRRVGCIPGGSIVGKRATGDVRAVTCPACKLLPEYLTVMAENEWSTPEDLDFPITLDAGQVAIVGTPPDMPAERPAKTDSVSAVPGCCP